MIKRVDLSTGEYVTYPVDPAVQRDYLGGLGLSVRLMADVSDLTLPPLDPRLPAIVSVGPLNATGFPGANRACFFGVSPLTGLTAPAWMGGDFATGLGRSGALALVLEGKAPEPSILVVREGGIEVVPRPDLWGLTTSETRTALESLYGRMPMAIIGPAGERLVAMASVRGNESHSAGRCGMGAVLGSKNIKAILANGQARPPLADAEEFEVASREAMKAVRESDFLMNEWRRVSTPGIVKSVNDFEAWPTGNFQKRYFETADRLYGDRIVDEYVIKRSTCSHCPVGCRLHVRVDGEELAAPEYETLWAFGPDNMVDDYALITRAVALCNDLGLDGISAGNAVAFYREYTGTLSDPSNMLDLVRAIAYREGAGDVLAEGTRRAAEHFGVDYAMEVKGLELPAYDPRKFIGMAISYCTANRGGCHMRSWTAGRELSGADFSAEELAKMVAEGHDAECVQDSLIVCAFVAGTVKPWYARALSHALGHEYDEAQLAVVGERIYTLERMLNTKRGVSADFDALPRRLKEGLVSPEKYEEGMRLYYQFRGWDTNGCPTAGKLAELALDAVI